MISASLRRGYIRSMKAHKRGWWKKIRRHLGKRGVGRHWVESKNANKEWSVSKEGKTIRR